MSILAQVFFGLLNTGEELFKEGFVFRLAIFKNHSQIRQATASPAAHKWTAGCLDGFMSEPVCCLLTT